MPALIQACSLLIPAVFHPPEADHGPALSAKLVDVVLKVGIVFEILESVNPNVPRAYPGAVLAEEQG